MRTAHHQRGVAYRRCPRSADVKGLCGLRHIMGSVMRFISMLHGGRPHDVGSSPTNRTVLPAILPRLSSGEMWAQFKTSQLEEEEWPTRVTNPGSKCSFLGQGGLRCDAPSSSAHAALVWRPWDQPRVCHGLFLKPHTESSQAKCFPPKLGFWILQLSLPKLM